MKALLESVLPILAPILLSVLTAGTGYVALHVGLWLQALAANSRLARALQVLFNLAVTIVQDIENNEKAQMLKDGKFDAVALKTLALARLKAVLGTEGLTALQQALGALVGGSIESYLSGTVERAVVTVKQPGLVAASPK